MSAYNIEETSSLKIFFLIRTFAEWNALALEIDLNRGETWKTPFEEESVFDGATYFHESRN
mgnify:CR=1 FL=1